MKLEIVTRHMHTKTAIRFGRVRHSFAIYKTNVLLLSGRAESKSLPYSYH